MNKYLSILFLFISVFAFSQEQQKRKTLLSLVLANIWVM